MKKTLLFMAFFGLSMAFSSPVLAASPYFTVTQEGGAGNYRYTVSGADSFQQVTLYRRYQGTELWTIITNFGYTDGNGYFSTLAGLGTNNIGSSVEQYVMVNGQSSGVVNTNLGGTGYGNIIFSPSNPSLSVGQTLSVSVYNGSSYSGAYYISSNSNSSVATASISGSSLTLYGQNSGSTTLSVCQNNYSQCASLYVTVSGGSGYGNITFSNSSPSLTVGQSTTINIYGGSYGSYNISSNSNSSVATASISGSSVYLYGQNSGSTTITVCQSGYSQCGSLYVTVSGGGSGGSIWFSPTSLSLNVGQNSSVTINGSNYYGTYYISSNSNSSVATAYISGNTVNVNGSASGNTAISVCQNNYSSCGSFTVYVSGSGYGGTINFSPTNPSLTVGQSMNVNIYGGGGTYLISGNTNPSIATANIYNNNQLTLYGPNSGSTTITVCQSNNSNCGTLFVTVGGGVNSLVFVGTSLPQPVVGEYYNVQLQVSGGQLPYNFVIISGSLPSGLTMGSNGQILGIPAAVASTSMSVRATDAQGRFAMGSFNLNTRNQGGLGSVLGTLVHNNGSLLRNNGTVYSTYKNFRTGFSSDSAFRGLGFKYSNVTEDSLIGLTNSGYVISTSLVSHPWGTWILSGRTVYFVHENGLIPVPSEEVFFNNGGSWALVVPANIYDLRLPALGAMTGNDSRLR